MDDYLTSLRLLAPHADYLAVNVSSPEHPGLRSACRTAARFSELLEALPAEAAGSSRARPVPCWSRSPPT